MWRKNGYASQRIEMTDAGYSQHTSVGNIWPKDQRVKVTLAQKDAPTAVLREAHLTLGYGDYPRQSVIELGDAQGRISAGPEIKDLQGPLPANALYVELAGQPTPTTGPDHRVDPLDIGLPAHATLKISAADGGFVRFVPTPGTSPLEQMAQAPTGGYSPMLELDGKRLRQMREKGNDYILEGHEFFFFRVNGKLGKGVVSWGRPENQPECRLIYGLFLQPDGTGNLRTLDGK